MSGPLPFEHDLPVPTIGNGYMCPRCTAVLTPDQIVSNSVARSRLRAHLELNCPGVLDRTRARRWRLNARLTAHLASLDENAVRDRTVRIDRRLKDAGQGRANFGGNEIVIMGEVITEGDAGRTWVVEFVDDLLEWQGLNMGERTWTRTEVVELPIARPAME